MNFQRIGYWTTKPLHIIKIAEILISYESTTISHTINATTKTKLKKCPVVFNQGCLQGVALKKSVWLLKPCGWSPVLFYMCCDACKKGMGFQLLHWPPSLTFFISFLLLPLKLFFRLGNDKWWSNITYYNKKYL